MSAPPHTYYQAIPERLGDHMKMMEDLNEIEAGYNGRCR
jgi:4-hydroxyphenylpyruvate dioxygenase